MRAVSAREYEKSALIQRFKASAQWLRRWRYGALGPAISGDGCRDPKRRWRGIKKETWDLSKGQGQLEILDLGGGFRVAGGFVFRFFTLLDHFTKRAGVLAIKGFAQALAQRAFFHGVSDRHAHPGRRLQSHPVQPNGQTQRHHHQAAHEAWLNEVGEVFHQAMCGVSFKKKQNRRMSKATTLLDGTAAENTHDSFFAITDRGSFSLGSRSLSGKCKRRLWPKLGKLPPLFGLLLKTRF